MRIDILTLFPEMFTPLNESIIGRAVDGGKVQIFIHDIRDYTTDKHKKCDDYPFGGGAGMLMMPSPSLRVSTRSIPTTWREEFICRRRARPLRKKKCPSL